MYEKTLSVIDIGESLYTIIVLREVAPLKALSPIFVIVLGSEMDVIFVPLKDSFPISFSPLGISTKVKLLHPSKVRGGIISTLEGITIDSNEEHP